ncbi:MAG: hypothetical protein V1846_02355 [Candidatus Komeilibacteria bacterium]
MFNRKDMLKSDRGAIALIAVVLVTMLVSIFAVSLAVMNLDYSLSIGSMLFDKSVMTATDGCLDASIGQLASYNGTASSNISNIGPANLNCSITVTSSGNERYLLASTASTAAFVNTVRNATSTINVATNPVTIQRYIEEVTQPADLLVDGGNVNVSTVATAAPSVAVDGQYAYITYRSTLASGRKLNTVQVDLNTFTSLTSLANYSVTTAPINDSLVYKGYLYVSYTSSACRLNLARIDLSNFSGGATLVESITTDGCSGDSLVTPPSLAAYGNYVYVNYEVEATGQLYLGRMDTSNFSVSGFSSVAVSTGQAYAADLAIKDGFAYTAYMDTVDDAYPVKLSKIDLSNWSVTNTITVKEVCWSSIALTIVDNNAYILRDSGDDYAFDITRVNLDSFTANTSVALSVSGSDLTALASAGFIYVGLHDTNDDAAKIIKFNVRTMTQDQSLGTYGAGVPSGQSHLAAPGGKYIYQTFYDAGGPANRLFRIQID